MTSLKNGEQRTKNHATSKTSIDHEQDNRSASQITSHHHDTSQSKARQLKRTRRFSPPDRLPASIGNRPEG